MPQSVEIPLENLKATAIHEIGHALVGVVLGLDLLHVTIAPVARVTPDVQTLGGVRFAAQPWLRRTRQQYLDMIAVYVAGAAAEDVFLGDHDDGWSGREGSDLHRATRVAIEMERMLGMGEYLVGLGEVDDRRLDEIRHMDSRLTMKVDEILREQFARASQIARRYRDVVLGLQYELLDRKELPGR